MKKQNINPKGFTIIEVILVLAIGSLIILMALVALPSLQASQRDTQRKTDYSTLEAAITSYTSNNRGKLPKTCTDSISADGVPARDTEGHCQFIATYIKDTWEDPTKGYYNVSIAAATATTTFPATLEAGDVKIYTSATCDGEKPKYDKKLGNRRYAIYAYLESGTFCQAD